MARTGRPLDLEPLERLEDKVKLLVAMVGRLRTEQARMADENARLSRDLEAARVRLQDVENTATEMAVLREERDSVRTRLGSLLEQLEALNL